MVVEYQTKPTKKKKNLIDQGNLYLNLQKKNGDKVRFKHKKIKKMMTLVGSLVAGLAATWKHVPEAATVRTKSRKKVLPNQLGRYYDNHSNNLVDSSLVHYATAKTKNPINQ